MPLSALNFRPGVHTDVTAYRAEGTWVDSSLVRFRNGDPETIGGWTEVETGFAGTPRWAHSWSLLDGTKVTAVGTATKLWLYDEGGSVHDITPLRASGNLTDPFSVTDGSATVTVAHAAHGAITGDTVIFSGAAAVGGITVDGAYVLTKVDADSYTVTHGAAASATAGGGGTVATGYEVNVGLASASGAAQLRTWTGDNWGEDLLCCHRGSKLIWWDASGGLSARATLVSASPTMNAVVVSAEDRHVIALGANGDPMRIMTCDQEDFANWTPGPTTTSDDRRLLNGSELIAGIRTAGEILLWTDAAVYAMRYTGGAFIWNLRCVGDGGGILGPNAAAERNGVVYWPGDDAFFRYAGAIERLDCTVLRRVFDNLDRDQRHKVTCGVNDTYGEVWWFLPDATSHENTIHVMHSIPDGWWAPGTLARTAWIPSHVFAKPRALTPGGVLYQHEDGTDAAGAAIEAFIESGDIDIGDGENIAFVRRLIPDFTSSGVALLTVKARNYPAGTQRSKSGYRIASGVDRVNCRIRGRQVAIRIETPGNYSLEEAIYASDGVNVLTDDAGAPIIASAVYVNAASYWRMGRLRIELQPNGRR